MLLGQVVAISVASSLFYLAVAISPVPKTASKDNKENKSLKASPLLWLCVLLSFLTVAYSPFTDERTFLPNLLVMHALLIIPLLFPSFMEGSKLGTPSSPLYSACCIISSLLHLNATRNALILNASINAPARHLTSTIANVTFTALSFLRELWATLHSHPAQASVGWDVIWTTVAFVAWHVYSTREKSVGAVMGFALDTMMMSVGPVAPRHWALGVQSGEGEVEEKSKVE
jgi:hypothetical protein